MQNVNSSVIENKLTVRDMQQEPKLLIEAAHRNARNDKILTEKTQTIDQQIIQQSKLKQEENEKEITQTNINVTNNIISNNNNEAIDLNPKNQG